MPALGVDMIMVHPDHLRGHHDSTGPSVAETSTIGQDHSVQCDASTYSGLNTDSLRADNSELRPVLHPTPPTDGPTCAGRHSAAPGGSARPSGQRARSPTPPFADVIGVRPPDVKNSGGRRSRCPRPRPLQGLVCGGCKVGLTNLGNHDGAADWSITLAWEAVRVRPLPGRPLWAGRCQQATDGHNSQTHPRQKTVGTRTQGATTTAPMDWVTSWVGGARPRTTEGPAAGGKLVHTLMAILRHNTTTTNSGQPKQRPVVRASVPRRWHHSQRYSKYARHDGHSAVPQDHCRTKGSCAWNGYRQFDT